MRRGVVTPTELGKLLPKVCGQETSHDGRRWRASNPFHGHCAVVAVLVQATLGGFVQWAKISPSARAEPVSHYWNILPDGTVRDFTGSQFRGKMFQLPKGRNITNSLVFIRIKKSKRYKLLVTKFREVIRRA